MLAVQGLYENGIVKVREPVPDYSPCDVIVTFLPRQNREFMLSDSKQKTVQEKNSAIESLLGICEGNTLTLDDIKTERLKRQ